MPQEQPPLLLQELETPASRTDRDYEIDYRRNRFSQDMMNQQYQPLRGKSVSSSKERTPQVPVGQGLKPAKNQDSPEPPMREQPQVAVAEEHPARASSKSLPRVKQLLIPRKTHLHLPP